MVDIAWKKLFKSLANTNKKSNLQKHAFILVMSYKLKSANAAEKHCKLSKMVFLSIAPCSWRYWLHRKVIDDETSFFWKMVWLCSTHRQKFLVYGSTKYAETFPDAIDFGLNNICWCINRHRMRKTVSKSAGTKFPETKKIKLKKTCCRILAMYYKLKAGIAAKNA